MKSFHLSILLILLFASLVYGQDNNYRCEVQILDKADDKIIPIGNLVINSDVNEEIIKSFKLPDSKLFAVVYYYKADPKAPNGERYLMLIVSKKPYRAIEEMKASNTVTNAVNDSAEPLEKIVLQTLYFETQKQFGLINLECSKTN